MNRCASRGFLVDGTYTIPTDPTDFHVENLPVVGCSHLCCTGCGALVRNAAALSFASPRDLASEELKRLYATADLASSPLLHGERPEWRLYLCRCRRWLETSKHACAEPDPEDSDPDMPWQCEGHPTLTLPHDLDGMRVTAGNLAEVVIRGFQGEAPPHVRQADKARGEWIARLHQRLPVTDANVVTASAFAAIRDPAPRTRACALRFFSELEIEQGRVFELFEREPALFAAVPDEITTIDVDLTLEYTVWRIVARLVGTDGKPRYLARSLALGGTANVATYYALAKYDSAWLASQAEELARATPGKLQELLASFTQFPKGVGGRPLRERVQKAATSGAAS